MSSLESSAGYVVADDRPETTRRPRPPPPPLRLVAVSPHDRVPRRLARARAGAAPRRRVPRLRAPARRVPGLTPPPPRAAAPRSSRPQESAPAPAPPPPRRRPRRRDHHIPKTRRPPPPRRRRRPPHDPRRAPRVPGEAPAPAPAPARRQSARLRRQDSRRRAEAGASDAAPETEWSGGAPSQRDFASPPAPAPAPPSRRRAAAARRRHRHRPSRRRTRRPPGRRKARRRTPRPCHRQHLEARGAAWLKRAAPDDETPVEAAVTMARARPTSASRHFLSLGRLPKPPSPERRVAPRSEPRPFGLAPLPRPRPRRGTPRPAAGLCVGALPARVVAETAGFQPHVWLVPYSRSRSGSRRDVGRAGRRVRSSETRGLGPPADISPLVGPV